jgi:hypothetical protein
MSENDQHVPDPEQLSESLKQKESARVKARAIVEEARIAINAAKENKNVEIALRYIMRISGFHQKPVVVGSDGDVKVNSTLFNAGREALYHDIRNLMSVETKNIIERSE